MLSKTKVSGKRKIVIIILAFVSLLLIYFAVDRIAFSVREQGIYDFSKSYVRAVGEINSYAHNSPDADENARLKKANMRKTLLKYESADIVESELPLADFKQTDSDSSIRINSIKVENAEKNPFSPYYSVSVSYKINFSYKKFLPVFEGSGFDTKNDVGDFKRDKSGNISYAEKCTLSFCIEKTDGKYRIVKKTGFSTNEI